MKINPFKFRLLLSLVSVVLATIFSCSNPKSHTKNHQVYNANSFSSDSLFSYELNSDCATESEFNDILTRGKTVVHSDTFPVIIYGEKGQHSDLFVRPIAVLPLSQDTLILVTPIDTTESSATCQDLIQFLTRCDRERLFIEVWLRDIQNHWPVDRVQWLDPYDFKK